MSDVINGYRFHEAYRSLLDKIMTLGVEELNTRTGHWTKQIPGGVSLKFPMDGIPVPGVRRVYPRSAAVEVAWFVMGTRNPEWINERAPHWRKFVDDSGLIEGAYGNRLRKAFGRDQIQMAVDALRADPSNRQVVLTMWDPSRDGLGGPNQPKNIPCPTQFTLNAVGGVLHMSLMIRSSDVFVGLPYDTMTFALILDAFAIELGMEPGSMHITLANAHVYDSHWQMARDALSRRSVCEPPETPCWPLSSILKDPDGYVVAVKSASAKVAWSDFTPIPEIIL